MIQRVNLLLLLSLLGISTAMIAQTRDIHLLESPAKGLFQHSAWAHGYIHGYEAGFHQGNLDFHMARPVQDPHSVKEYKKSGKTYHPSFGSRPDFQKGYGSGFEVGYLDGSSGREFRAASETNRLSSVMDASQDVQPRQAEHLDELLDSGYLQGRRAGLSDARAKLESRESDGACPDNAKSRANCSAYLAGFRWGYSDGYSNQRSEANTQRASK